IVREVSAKILECVRQGSTRVENGHLSSERFIATHLAQCSQARRNVWSSELPHHFYHEFAPRLQELHRVGGVILRDGEKMTLLRLSSPSREPTQRHGRICWQLELRGGH